MEGPVNGCGQGVCGNFTFNFALNKTSLDKNLLI